MNQKQEHTEQETSSSFQSLSLPFVEWPTMQDPNSKSPSLLDVFGSFSAKSTSASRQRLSESYSDSHPQIPRGIACEGFHSPVNTSPTHFPYLVPPTSPFCSLPLPDGGVKLPSHQVYGWCSASATSETSASSSFDDSSYRANNTHSGAGVQLNKGPQSTVLSSPGYHFPRPSRCHYINASHPFSPHLARPASLFGSSTGNAPATVTKTPASDSLSDAPSYHANNPKSDAGGRLTQGQHFFTSSLGPGYHPRHPGRCHYENASHPYLSRSHPDSTQEPTGSRVISGFALERQYAPGTFSEDDLIGGVGASSSTSSSSVSPSDALGPPLSSIELSTSRPSEPDVVRTRVIKNRVASAAHLKKTMGRRKKAGVFFCELPDCGQNFTARHNLKSKCSFFHIVITSD
jgi:hypothetical protein